LRSTAHSAFFAPSAFLAPSAFPSHLLQHFHNIHGAYMRSHLPLFYSFSEHFASSFSSAVTSLIQFLTYSQVSSAPPGTQAATLDIEAAYRTIPVWLPHKKFLVVGFEGFFWIDHTFPFSLTTAGGVQGNVADATVDILAKLDCHIHISTLLIWTSGPQIQSDPIPDPFPFPSRFYLHFRSIHDKLSNSFPVHITLT
jgi:hypothetical protein